jgi:hypothetical protein
MSEVIPFPGRKMTPACTVDEVKVPAFTSDELIRFFYELRPEMQARIYRDILVQVGMQRFGPS